MANAEKETEAECRVISSGGFRDGGKSAHVDNLPRTKPRASVEPVIIPKLIDLDASLVVRRLRSHHRHGVGRLRYARREVI